MSAELNEIYLLAIGGNYVGFNDNGYLLNNDTKPTVWENLAGPSDTPDVALYNLGDGSSQQEIWPDQDLTKAFRKWF